MTEKIEVKKRIKINWLLILQGWAMLWVVIGHSSLLGPDNGPVWESCLTKFAYSFHMQLFILVSGWLFFFTRLNIEKEWGYAKTIGEKTVRLLVPGLVFSLIAIAVKLVFPGDMSRAVDMSLGGGTSCLFIPT